MLIFIQVGILLKKVIKQKQGKVKLLNEVWRGQAPTVRVITMQVLRLSPKVRTVGESYFPTRGAIDDCPSVQHLAAKSRSFK